ncbi:hypothetical protein FKM82_024949 [Ascaphus truei]
MEPFRISTRESNRGGQILIESSDSLEKLFFEAKCYQCLIQKSQSILSNAFSASKLNSIAFEPDIWTWSTILIIFRVLSDAWRPETNPTWSVWMSLGKMGLSLFASILLYNFRSLFSNDIGL